MRDRSENVPPVIALYRGEELVAHITMGLQQRDVILDVARIAITGFSADVAALIVEGWQTECEDNPVTGQPWGPNEMQDLVDHHDGIAKGWISDGMTVMSVNRAGDTLFTSLLLRIHGRRVKWTREIAKEVDARGGVPEALVSYMNMPGLSTAMATSPEGQARRAKLSHEQAQAHDDGVTTKILMRMFRDYRVIVALNPGEPGSERQGIIEESLANDSGFRMYMVQAPE